MISTKLARWVAGILFLAPNCIAQSSQQTDQPEEVFSPYQREPKGFGFNVKISATFQSQLGPIAFSNIPQTLRTAK